MDEELKRYQEGLAKAQHDMAQVLEQAGENLDFKKVTCVNGSDEEKAAAFRKMNDDCSDFQKKIDARRLVLKAKEDHERRSLVQKVTHPKSGSQPEKKDAIKFESIADTMIKAAGLDPESFDRVGSQLKEHFWNKEVELPLGFTMKTLMETGAGWAPESLRTGKFVDKAVRPIQVLDLIPGGVTSMAAVVYIEETTLTENAGEESEGGEYGENAYAVTEQSSAVRKIACFVPVTDEQLEDVPQVRGYLNRRLPEALRRRLDNQIVNGDGSAPNLRGIVNLSGVQTHIRASVGGDKPVDALYRAMTKVSVVGRSVPNGVIINPYDWEDIRLMKTNDGAYVWGHPGEAGPERVWGKAIAVGDVIAEGTAIVGDFLQSELAERRGIMVKISDSHSDYFIKGKQAVRADMRAALIFYRPAAFCLVTL